MTTDSATNKLPAKKKGSLVKTAVGQLMSGFRDEAGKCLAVVMCLAFPEFGKIEVNEPWVVVNLGTENKRSTGNICKTIQKMEETVGSEVSRIGTSSAGIVGRPTKFFNAKEWLDGLKQSDVPSTLASVIREETFDSLFAFPDDLLTEVEKITQGNKTKLLPYPRPEQEGQTFK